MLDLKSSRATALALGGCLCLSLAGCEEAAKAVAPPRAVAAPKVVLPETGWTALPESKMAAAEARRRYEHGYAEISEDIDGDGKADRARLVMHADAGLYAVDVQLASGVRERLAAGPLAETKTKVLKIAPRGQHVRNCGYYNAEMGAEIRCGPIFAEDVVLERRAINLFDIDSKYSTFVVWRGGALEAMVMDGPMQRPDGAGG